MPQYLAAVSYTHLDVYKRQDGKPPIIPDWDGPLFCYVSDRVAQDLSLIHIYCRKERLFMAEKTCCVTGHRDIPEARIAYVEQELRREVEEAVSYTHLDVYKRQQ